MALVSFTPDATAPPGTGWFTNDSGRTIYTTDLDGARAVPPAPSQPSSTAAEPPASPGTTVSYAGDPNSPYANAVASNEGATGSAAVGAPPGATGIAHTVAAKALTVVPPAGAAPVAAGAGAPPRSAEELTAHAASVVPPVVKDTTTKVLGRKAGDVNAQIATDRAALGTYTDANTASAVQKDAKDLAAQDKLISTDQAQAAQVKENELQHATDARAAEERVKQYMALPDGELDPDRFVNSLSTGSKIGLTVLAAISGFANGMRNAGGPNSQGGPPDLSVLNVLQRRIDEDISSQKDQLAQGRLRKSNLIARAMAQGATAQQADLAAQAQLYSLAAHVGELQAQRIKLDGANLAASKQFTDAAMYQSKLKEAELRTTEEAKIQTTHEVESGKAGAAGASPELQNKAWEAYNKAIDAGQDRTTAYQQSGLASLGVSQPTGASKEDRSTELKAGERTEDQAKMAGVLTAATAQARALGYVRGPDGWAPGGKRGTEAQRVAARTAYETALKAAGYDKDAVNEATKEEGSSSVGSKALELLPFGFLFSHTTSADEAAAQLNAFENTTQQRLSQRDRGAPKAGAPEAYGGKPLE